MSAKMLYEEIFKSSIRIMKRTPCAVIISLLKLNLCVTTCKNPNTVRIVLRTRHGGFMRVDEKFIV